MHGGTEEPEEKQKHPLHLSWMLLIFSPLLALFLMWVLNAWTVHHWGYLHTLRAVGSILLLWSMIVLILDIVKEANEP